MAFALKGRGGEQRSIDEWAAELGATGGACDVYATAIVPDSLVRLPVITPTRFDDPGEWERRFAAHEALKAELKAKLAKNTAELEAAKTAVAEAQAAEARSALLAELDEEAPKATKKKRRKAKKTASPKAREAPAAGPRRDVADSPSTWLPCLLV